ncbi:MAG: VCBS repeat-containing protein [Planctomycetota bacterium]
MRAVHSLPLFSTLLAALAFCSTASAQQFVDGTASRFPVQNEYSSQVAIADVDGDGDLDVAFANGRGFSFAQTQEQVRLYINNGLGFFADESVARLGVLTGYGRDVEFGDIDNDGDLDLFVANDFNTQPQLLRNNGSGTFQNITGTHLPAITLGSSHACFGDVDNDGDLDLWITNGGTSRFGAGQAQLWENDGTGVYSNSTSDLPQQLVGEPMDCIFGDVDGDFDLDMVEGHRNGQSKLYRNVGNAAGVFADVSNNNFPPDSATYSYDFGDLNGDGHLDLLGANSLPGSSREALFINNGAGNFTDNTNLLLPGANNPNIDDNDSKFFDFDNDGDLDFVVASLSGQSSERFYRNTNGSFTLLSGIISNIPDASLDIELGDLDGDGDLDIVTAQGESGNFQNRIYMNSGPADTLPPTFPRLEELADTLDTAGPYVVRCVVRDSMTSDHNFFAESVNLVYTVGLNTTTIPMRWSGGDIYRAEIPGQPGGSMVTYMVEATDHNANLGTSGSWTFAVGPIEQFDRGDCNNDGSFNVADAVFMLGLLFPAGPPAVADCDDACDANDDNSTDISDPIAMLTAIFPQSSPPPVLPAPFGSCGADPTADGMNCASFTACP